MEGVLCGLSETPIPAEYSHGTEIKIGVKFFGRSGRQLAETTVRSWADRWDERAVKHQTTERPVTVMQEVKPSAAAQPFSSGLYEGGEIDSRAQHGLRAKEPKGVDPWRQLPEDVERGTGTPTGKDRRGPLCGRPVQEPAIRPGEWRTDILLRLYGYEPGMLYERDHSGGVQLYRWGERSRGEENQWEMVVQLRRDEQEDTPKIALTMPYSVWCGLDANEMQECETKPPSHLFSTNLSAKVG